MIRKITPLIILIVFSIEQGFAQQAEKTPYRYAHTVDLAFSTSSGSFAAALSWFHTNRVIKKIPKLKLGYGLRYIAFVGANKYYTTAPARFTSPVQNPGTIFSKTIEENIDTITTATTATNSMNIAIAIEYALTRRLDVGFNIDVFGFSFGAKRDFNVISSSFDPNQAPLQTAAPTRWDALLTSDNDIGSLNSEFFLRYWIARKIGIRAGYTFLFSEYQTDKGLSFDNGRIVNDRYRYKVGMLLIAATFRPFN